MNLFNRLFKIGQAEAHSAVDQLENPIHLTEQGIRDLRTDLDTALHALADVKAMAIRARNESELAQGRAADYESKAIQLLQRAHRGDLDSAEADRLAAEALVRKAENEKAATTAAADQAKFEAAATQLEQNVQQLKTTISQWENELRGLKARVRVSDATRTINQQLARLDSSGTLAMLERMKDKVAQDEALAESYGQIAQESRSVDAEIDKALAQGGVEKAKLELQALKERLALPPASPQS